MFHQQIGRCCGKPAGITCDLSLFLAILFGSHFFEEILVLVVRYTIFHMFWPFLVDNTLGYELPAVASTNVTFFAEGNDFFSGTSGEIRERILDVGRNSLGHFSGIVT